MSVHFHRALLPVTLILLPPLAPVHGWYAVLRYTQLDDLREMDMLSEAATVEAVWAVEPNFLEDVLFQEIEMFCSEQVHCCPQDCVEPFLLIASYHSVGALVTILYLGSKVQDVP